MTRFEPSIDDIDAVVAGLRVRGAELVGEVERYGDGYRLCYVRGPEGSSSSWRSRSAEGSGRRQPPRRRQWSSRGRIRLRHRLRPGRGRSLCHSTCASPAKGCWRGQAAVADRARDARIWAAGAIYAVGQVNFLFDRTQTPHLTAEQLAGALRVVKTTMANKAGMINRMLDIGIFEPDLTRVVMIEQHPMAWLVEVDGLILGADEESREVQEEARRLGTRPLWSRGALDALIEDLTVLDARTLPAE